MSTRSRRGSSCCSALPSGCSSDGSRAPEPVAQRAGLCAFGGLWAATSLSLYGIFVVQESLEGLFASGHPGGLDAVVGHGGWWAMVAAAEPGRGRRRAAPRRRGRRRAGRAPRRTPAARQAEGCFVVRPREVRARPRRPLATAAAPGSGGLARLARRRIARTGGLTTTKGPNMRHTRRRGRFRLHSHPPSSPRCSRPRPRRRTPACCPPRRSRAARRSRSPSRTRRRTRPRRRSCSRCRRASTSASSPTSTAGSASSDDWLRRGRAGGEGHLDVDRRGDVRGGARRVHGPQRPGARTRSRWSRATPTAPSSTGPARPDADEPAPVVQMEESYGGAGAATRRWRSSRSSRPARSRSSSAVSRWHVPGAGSWPRESGGRVRLG